MDVEKVSYSARVGNMKLFFLIVALCIVTGESFAMNEKVEWNASWIWKQRDVYTGYNDTIEARTTIELPAIKSASLRITTDTRYRLYINDVWVNDGPSRSWPHHYQYDRIDVGNYLKEGRNTIRVIAKFYGIGTFHQIPQEAGLLAQLEATGLNGKMHVFGTDDTWEVRDASSWLRNTPKQSVQMGPFEIYDAREIHHPFEQAVVRYAADQGPWHNLEERDCPLLTRTLFPLKAFHAANSIARPTAQTFIFPTASWLYPHIVFSNHRVSTTGAFATILELPEGGGEVSVEADGQTIFIEGNRASGNRFQLSSGRHLLHCVLSDVWGHWRNDTEICLLSDRPMGLLNPLDEDRDAPWCFVTFGDNALYHSADYAWSLMEDTERNSIQQRITEIVRDKMKSVPEIATIKQSLAGDAIKLPADACTPAPHYLFKSRQVLGSAEAYVDEPENLPANSGAVVIHPSPDGDIELIYDLGEQNVGYYEFVIDAEEGLILDIFGVEYIAPSGAVQHTERYRNGMRYICREGENHFLSFMRRSQRYLFLTLRNQTKPAVLRQMQLIESTYPVQKLGSFACSDERLNRIWEISARTLKLCMEDVFTDCPLYEQTLWVGDARNEALFAYTAFGAEDIARRCIRLAALSLDKHPMVQSQVPSTWETLLPAWSFLWNIMIWDYYVYTGDKDLLEWVYPYAMKNLRNAATFSDERGLFSAPFWNMFDWSGIDDGHNTVLHNSMFAAGAVNATLKVADVLGKTDDAEWLQEYGKQLKDAINGLWSDTVRTYPDSIHNNGAISKRTSVHTAFLAILYDIAPIEHQEALIGHLLNAPEGMTPLGSPFAMLYLFEAMEKAGLQERIIERILEAYQPMLDLEATTVWETFAGALNHQGEFPTRSHTHAWSSSPLYFLNRIILGIVPRSPGGTSFLISPRPNDLSWAKGASATAYGPIEVSWELKENHLQISANAPDEVDLQFVTNETLDGYEITFNGHTVP